LPGICIRGATGVNTRYCQPTAAIIRTKRLGQSIADAGLGQHQLHSLRSLAIAAMSAAIERTCSYPVIIGKVGAPSQDFTPAK
jgi:hypothetical protein